VKPGTFQSGLGRWYALESAASSGKDESEPAVAWTHELLKRFGIVTKDTVAAFSPFSWDSHQSVLRQLEEWGMVTRGFFVRGVQALQFASRETVESLREPWSGPSGKLTLLSAADPACPFGTVVDWPERKEAAFARKPGNFLVLREGRWLLWIENNGRRISVMDETERGVSPVHGAVELARGLPELFRDMLKQNGLRKLTIEQWNGIRAADSEAKELLEGLGAEKDRKAYVFWPSSFG
jgi:ATP-dependent Lhr-like helicase